MAAGSIVGALLLLTITASAATDPTVESCKRFDFKNGSADSTQCALYVSGFMDGLIFAEYDKKKEKSFCIPDSATAWTIASKVKQHLKDDSYTRNAPMAPVLAHTLILEYPCKN